MLQILADSHGAYQLPVGSVMTVQPSSIGSSVTVSLLYAQAPVGFTQQSSVGSAQFTVGPFAAEVIVTASAKGSVGVDIAYGSGSGLPTPPGAGKVLTSTGNTAGAADWQDPAAVANSTLFVPHTDAIPLNLAGFGSAASGIVMLSTNHTLSLGANARQGGTYEFTSQQDGTGGHTIGIPGTWKQRGTDVAGTAPGARNKYVFEFSDDDVIFAIIPLTTVDSNPATFGARSIENGAPDTIAVVMSKTIGSIIPLTTDVTLTGAAGRTVIGVTKSGATLLIQCSSNFTWNVAPSIAIAANKVSDLSGNLSGALATSAVANNLTIPVPNAPGTPTLGTATSTSQPLSWTASPIDATHGPATLYQVQYRTGVAAFANFGAPTASLGLTVTGLASTTLYDYRVIASNGTGTGGTSATASGSTAAGGSPTLVASDLTVPTSIDLDTFRDWLRWQQNAGNARQEYTPGNANVKIVRSVLGTDTDFTPANATAQTGTTPTLHSTAGGYNYGAGGISPPWSDTLSNIIKVLANPSVDGQKYRVPATNSSQSLILVYAGYRFDAFGLDRNGSVQFTATLTDGSAGPITVTKADSVPFDQDYILHCTQIDFRSAGGGFLDIVFGADGLRAMPILQLIALV